MTNHQSAAWTHPWSSQSKGERFSESAATQINDASQVRVPARVPPSVAASWVVLNYHKLLELENDQDKKEIESNTKENKPHFQKKGCIIQRILLTWLELRIPINEVWTVIHRMLPPVKNYYSLQSDKKTVWNWVKKQHAPLGWIQEIVYGEVTSKTEENNKDKHAKHAL